MARSLVNLQIGLFRAAGSPMWLELNFQFHSSGDFDPDWLDYQVQCCIVGDETDTQYIPVIMWHDQSNTLDWTRVNVEQTMKNVNRFILSVHDFKWSS